MCIEHEEATEKFSRVSKVRETDRVSLCSKQHIYNKIIGQMCVPCAYYAN